MNGFKGYNLWDGFVDLLQQFLQMNWIVMSENVFGHFAVADALDHGGMVSCVREYIATWNRYFHISYIMLY